MRQFVAVGLLALIAGCGGNGYRNVNGTMAYQTWDESNGTRTTYLQNADLDSFQQLSNPEYAKDKNNVYYCGVQVWYADPKTFQLLDFPYAKDAHRAYSLTVPIDTHNVEAFEVLLGTTGRMHRVDISERREEFDELFGKIETVPEDQEIYVGTGWARDDKVCYFGPIVLPDADPNTFKALDNWYANDANHVYYERHILAGADPQSFRTLGSFEAADAYHRYDFGERKP